MVAYSALRDTICAWTTNVRQGQRRGSLGNSARCSTEQISKTLSYSEVSGLPTRNLRDGLKEQYVMLNLVQSPYSTEIFSGLRQLHSLITSPISDANGALTLIFGEGNERIARIYFKTVSLLRKVYPYYINLNDPRGNLHYALDKKIFFKIGTNLYLTPITESFRRSIIFGTKDDRISFATEIMIPGELWSRRHVYAAKRRRITQELNATWPDRNYTAKSLLIRKYPSKIYELYGRKAIFIRNIRPFEIAAFEYNKDGKRLMSLTPFMLEAIATKYDITQSKLDRWIATRVAEIVCATHSLGYCGVKMSGMYDHHLENFRISLSHEKLNNPINSILIQLVGDFASFVRPTLFSSYRRDFDIAVIIEGWSGFLGLQHLLITLESRDIYDIFLDTYNHMFPRSP